MIAGLSIATPPVLFHVAISLIGIVSGLIVLFRMLRAPQAAWLPTALFLRHRRSYRA